jgi:RNA-directed DNA polymerase
MSDMIGSLAKVARRVDDADVLHLLKLMLKANGQRGVPQGGVISPLLSNLYLNEVDRMLERAKETTRYGKYTYIEYARFADDLVILIDAYQRHDWLMAAVEKRLREEFAELQVEINEEKSRNVDLGRGESFGFLGFDFRRMRSRRAYGVSTTRRSSRSELRCCVSSKTCSAATNRNQWIGS